MTTSSAVQRPERAPFKAWMVWLVASLFYLYEMVLRVSPSVMTEGLTQDFHVSATSLGVLVSFYYFAYVPLQVPCGLIVDKFGTRKIVTLSTLICILGTYLFAESQNLWLAQIGRFLIGAGSACAFISCLKVSAEWFRPHQFALVAGLSNMMGTLGSTFAGRPLATLVQNYGWRPTTLMLATAGFLVAIMSWFCIQDNPTPTEQEKHDAPKLWPSLQEVVKNKQIWLAAVVGGFMYLPISAFSELWAVPFLINTYQINSELASTANVMLFLGMAIGGPIAAWLAKYCQNYVKVMRLSALATAVLFTAIACAQWLPLNIMFVILLLAGMTIGGQVLCFTCAKNNTSHEISGTTVAFTNAIVMMSGVIFQPLLGLILDMAWDGKISAAGHRIYSESNYQIAILAVPICLFASAFILRWVKDSYSTEE
ncbi:MFS transporter [Candidatus Finniella inopinata]|nr:MFS transporter [Candidatus Finniella inopinata]